MKFTRLQTSVERLLPKLIISLPKSGTDNCYKIRYGASSSLTFVLLVLALIFMTATVLVKHGNLLALLFPGGLLALYGFLTNLEMRFLGAAMRRALQQ